MRDPFTTPSAFRPSAHGPVVPFAPAEDARALPVLRAYVDETGDRGRPRGNSSPIFGMAGVLVTAAGEAAARQALRRLREDFGTPPGRPLSWKEDLKNHDRRVHAANLLASVDELQVVYVLVHKASLREGTYGDDVTLLYNVIAYETLRRILWAAKHWRDGRRQVEIRFGHVAKHDDQDTHRYFQLKRSEDHGRVPFGLVSSLTWVNASQYEMSQVADVYGGFLKAGFWPNRCGNVEGAYLRQVWRQIRNSDSCVLTLGLQPRPSSDVATSLPWWPCPDCPGQPGAEAPQGPPGADPSTGSAGSNAGHPGRLLRGLDPK